MNAIEIKINFTDLNASAWGVMTSVHHSTVKRYYPSVNILIWW